MSKYIIFAFFIAPVLVACSPTVSQDISQSIENQSTTSLWIEHRQTPSPLRLAFIEAELAERGETRFGTSYIGQRTSSAFGNTLYSRSPTNTALGTDLRNCDDFSSAASAQKYFLASGGPLSDPNDLDRDGDGLACEWGTRVRQISRAARAPVRTTVSRPTISRRCYVGPRGGTYTITASGARDYDGC
ncbi:excalibur calcium-binding domain-containing protein [Yoonia sp. SDW83-1]|uniref:excalibur calcium-binding domain-containing protein n=1 Tax=Yoonia sp. SDW83-1 TaxID=3366945 RepID=UPI00398C3720